MTDLIKRFPQETDAEYLARLQRIAAWPDPTWPDPTKKH